MMAQSPSWTDIITASSTAVTAIILGLTAAYASRQVAEARRLREAQVRPFVMLAFETDDYPLIILRIRNTGSVIARNVRMSFEPPLQTSEVLKTKTPLRDLPLFSEGIPSLPPGRGLPVMLDSYFEIEKGNLPRTYRVHITYEGEVLRRKGQRATYEDDFVLDLRILEEVVRLEGTPTKQIVDALKAIRDALRDLRHSSSDPFRDLVRRSGSTAEPEGEQP